MDRICELKELLKNVVPVNENTKKPADNEIVMIEHRKNPLDPNLLSYCFDNVLGFDVRYRIYEKVNYIIEFDYKGTYGYVAHEKLSFAMLVHRDHEDEIIDLFSRARNILSEHFLQCGKEVLESNDFTMENESHSFKEKLDFFAERIEDLHQTLHKLEEEQPKDIKEIFGAAGDGVSKFNAYQKLKRKNRLEMLYSIETYIDVFFSYLEHVLTLLYPFTPNFDQSKSYSTNYIHNPHWTWDKKLENVGLGDEEITEFVERLREIKEIYRNRNAHGMFSRELKAYVQIDGFGRYPMYLGKNYLQGFVDDYDTVLDYEKFIEIKELFDRLMERLRHMYAIPMVFIDAGAPIPVLTADLTRDISTKEEAEYAAMEYLYEIDNQWNMDW